jgi:hypothetical protein
MTDCIYLSDRQEEKNWGPYDDRERDSEIVHQSPIATQFLLVAKLGQHLLILLIDRRSAPPTSMFWICHLSSIFILFFFTFENARFQRVVQKRAAL